MDKILEMKRDLAEKAQKFREFVEKITQEKRGATPEESKERDTLKGEIVALQSAITEAEEARSLTASIPAPAPASPAARSATPEAPSVIPGGRKEELEPGIRLARFVKATLVSQKEGRSMDSVIESMYPRDAVLKEMRSAMGTNVSSEGGVLVPEDLASEIIPLLREQSSIRSLGARVVPMPNGSLKIPRQTGAANFQWVGENKSISASKVPLGMLNLSAKKLAGLIPASNELISSPTVAADQFIRDELINGIVEAEDITAIYGSGTENAPAGIAKIAGSNTDLNALPTSDTLGTIVGIIMGKKFPSKANFGWVFSGVLWPIFYNLKDGGNNYIHRAEMERGFLAGAPFRINNNVTVGADAHGLTEIYFGDFSQFIVGETLGIQIAVSHEASYPDGNTMVSAFANDQTVMRVLLREDFGVRYPDAFVVKSKVYSK